METNTTPSDAFVDGAHPGLTESHRGTYITIFLTLGFLTFLELFVPAVYGAEWSGTLKMMLLVILAVVKAALVALFFMHLKHEAKWVRWIGYMPIYMAFAVIIIMLETVYR
ncbi:MAG: cytochrome c oxidase subunit 4 [Candidatus Paceibacteria bacterium]|jgi:cytochrome c oxidase subunit 4